MTPIFRSLLLVIAGVTQRELAREIRYLKVENEVLRSKLPARITVMPKERQRLLKFGAKLARAIQHLITIVAPSTFLRWIREAKGSRRADRVQSRGRPRTSEQIRRLVLKLARENNWGYKRIVGELKKLGIRRISVSNVRNILKAAGLDPCPKRAEKTWDQFLQEHAASFWQCDFVSQKVLTLQGLRHAFFLVFLHLESRRVIFSPAVLHPSASWVQNQSELFVQQARSSGLRVRYLQHDRDAKFTAELDRSLCRRHVKVVKTPARSPNCQAFVESFIGSLRRECLNHFVFFGTGHLDSVKASYREFYLTDRPHQGKENELLTTKRRRLKRIELDEPLAPSDVCCHKRLGGLLKSYSRKAA